ncbi:hypothetical protein RFI_23168 [Reticulomyxa filosa]|uniref:ATP-dependent (S)-NAD(P)H-hydrate dehydratase n=1 Tax=Reticulomyxa filosa TaxID=46433 RepID=X6MK03_RETFI|nr:hypothetical protein RFI_23168 [Reticulomyxa filosa]|eukprot:ETO14199.1 hypothetical protein RFI_23168 [Reticulomyxa filosa]
MSKILDNVHEEVNDFMNLPKLLRAVIPQLSLKAYKALRNGGDLALVVCHEAASTAIKSYSPELIVLPGLSPSDTDTFEWKVKSSTDNKEDNYRRIPTKLSKIIDSSLSRCSAVICGPYSTLKKKNNLFLIYFHKGLGRDKFMLDCCAYILKSAKDRKIPVVVDGDGLFLLCDADYNEWAEENRFENYELGVLTPNAMEFRRLWIRYVLKMDVNKYEQSNNKGKAQSNEVHLPPMETSDCLPHIIPISQIVTEEEKKDIKKIVEGQCYSCEHFQHISSIADTGTLAKTLRLTILRKGVVDVVSDGKYFVVSCSPVSLRRCGGQGDVLAGTAGVWAHWAKQFVKENSSKNTLPSVGVISAYAGSFLLRHFAEAAFKRKHRSTLTTDIIEAIPDVLEEIFPSNAKL